MTPTYYGEFCDFQMGKCLSIFFNIGIIQKAKPWKAIILENRQHWLPTCNSTLAGTVVSHILKNVMATTCALF